MPVSFGYLARSAAGTECMSRGNLHQGPLMGWLEPHWVWARESWGIPGCGGSVLVGKLESKQVQPRGCQGALCRGWPIMMAGPKADIDKEVTWKDG